MKCLGSVSFRQVIYEKRGHLMVEGRKIVNRHTSKKLKVTEKTTSLVKLDIVGPR